MSENSGESNNKTQSPLWFELYKIAIETRNLEIKLFWTRSLFFLVASSRFYLPACAIWKVNIIY